MDFDPKNKIIQLCVQGLGAEAKGNAVEASALFLQAWHGATNHFEQLIAAHFVALRQKNAVDRLKWHQTALQMAIETKDDTVKTALPTIYTNIGKAYTALGDMEKAEMNYRLAESFTGKIYENGLFCHGTKADLQHGDLLMPGNKSNYSPDLTMNHIYFTALINGAGLAASLAKGEGRERVYIVEPTGVYENDPNVTDKKFPGNLTRSYRTTAPLKIVGEITDWVRQSPGELQKWREKLANNKGEIIN